MMMRGQLWHVVMLGAALSCGRKGVRGDDVDAPAATSPDSGETAGGTAEGEGGAETVGGDDDGVPTVAGSISTSLAAEEGETVTHIDWVMAVNPAVSRLDRVAAAVEQDGFFSLQVEAGRPYVLVFVDSTRVGADMAVAIFRSETLDTVLSNGNDIDLGEVSIDASSGIATSGVPYDELLATVGLTAEEGAYLGQIDDLSLRYANPDIDGNGIPDFAEDRAYLIDFHLRAMLHQASGALATVADITDTFLATDVSRTFSVGSVYVVYGSDLDGGDYVSPTGELQNSAAFAAAHVDASAVSTPIGFSGSSYGTMRQWGPDYDWTQDAAELPGAGTSPATLAFTLGSTQRTLSFHNVVTQTAKELATTTLMPSLRLNTSGGVITSVDYRWMQPGESGWEPAAATALELGVSDDVALVGFYLGVKDKSVTMLLQPQPEGSVAWNDAELQLYNVTPEELASARPQDICGMNVAYDDKLGQRIMSGGVAANAGTTPCY